MKLLETVKREKEREEALYTELKEKPINLDEIIMDMVNVIKYNYAGFEQKRLYFTPNEYKTYIYSHYRYHSLTLQMLARSLFQMTADMHDRNLKFSCSDWVDFKNVRMQYRVRAYGDYLYVTSADEGTGLVPGDKIIAMRKLTPNRVRRLTRYNQFYSKNPERELWGGYLRMVDTLFVEHEDGKTEKISISEVPADAMAEKYDIEFSMLNEKTAYLKAEEFDRKKLKELIKENRDNIASSSKLIIDLRRCKGGDEDALYDLFPYIIDEKRKLSELIKDEGHYTYYTKTNCDLRISILENYKNSIADPEQMAILDDAIGEYKKNYGKGFVYVPAEELEDDKTFSRKKEAPEKVIILTDTFCENEAEQFVAMCRNAGKKVSLIGRPTMGTLDFFDNINLKLNEHMSISYPVSMSKKAYMGEGICEKGLPVDEYIAWSPREIHEDVILNRALEI